MLQYHNVRFAVRSHQRTFPQALTNESGGMVYMDSEPHTSRTFSIELASPQTLPGVPRLKFEVKFFYITVENKRFFP